MILLFSDLHGNKKACKEIEKISSKFECILFAGDICGYGKDFKYCINALKDMNVLAVLGNHDRMVVSGEDLRNEDPRVRASIEWHRERLEEKEFYYLNSLPTFLSIKDIYVTHSYHDEYICNKDQCHLVANMADNDLIVLGHTHIQMDVSIGKKRIVNPGSISKGRQGHPRGYATWNNEEIMFIKLGEI